MGIRIGVVYSLNMRLLVWSSFFSYFLVALCENMQRDFRILVEIVLVIIPFCDD